MSGRNIDVIQTGEFNFSLWYCVYIYAFAAVCENQMLLFFILTLDILLLVWFSFQKYPLSLNVLTSELKLFEVTQKQ